MIAQLLLIAAAFLAGTAVVPDVGIPRWRQLMAAALCCFILSRLFRQLRALSGYHHHVITLVFLIAAAILSGLATFGISRWNLLAAAFCCYVLSVLLPGMGVG